MFHALLASGLVFVFNCVFLWLSVAPDFEASQAFCLIHSIQSVQQDKIGNGRASSSFGIKLDAGYPESLQINSELADHQLLVVFICK